MKSFVSFILLLLLVSCKKEDVTSLDGLLKKVSYSSAEFPDNSYIISYNNRLQIDKVTNILQDRVTGYSFYHYDNLGNLTYIDDNTGIVRKKYLYNSKNQLKVFYNINFNDTISYDYDLDGYMILERNKYFYRKYDYDFNNNRITYRIYNNSDSLLAEVYYKYYTTLDPMHYVDPSHFDKYIQSECYTKAEYEVNGTVTVYSGEIISGNSSSSSTAKYVLSTSLIELSTDNKIWSSHTIYKDSSPDLWIQYEFY